MSFVKEFFNRLVCYQDLQQVEDQLRQAKERLGHRKKVLVQCFAHAGYSL